MSTEDAAPSAADGAGQHCGDDHCCGCCTGVTDSEPTALGRALERLLGVTAALCAVALMVGGTVALLRWWL